MTCWQHRLKTAHVLVEAALNRAVAAADTQQDDPADTGYPLLAQNSSSTADAAKYVADMACRLPTIPVKSIAHSKAML